MTLNDRFSRGLISGVIAGIFMDIVDYTAILLNIGRLTHWDWVGTIIFGTQPNTLAEEGLSIVGHIIFAGMLGVLFIYLLKILNDKNLLLKSVFYGLFMWYFLYSVTFLFKVKGLMYIQVGGVVADIISAMVFGLVLGLSSRWLQEKLNL